MKTTIFIAAMLLASLGVAQNAGARKLSGTVVDSAGQPVIGATVEYWRYGGNVRSLNDPGVSQQTTTGTNGAYQLETSSVNGCLLARKPGLAPAWARIAGSYSRTENTLVLTPEGTLAGQVLDESNHPVANAVVSVAVAVQSSEAQPYNPLFGKTTRDLFSAHTDPAGHFQIDHFPTNAAALLDVRFPGKALPLPTGDFSDINSSGYHAGQPDIKLVLEPGGVIEGKIRGTDPHSLSAQLVLLPAGNTPWWEQDPVSTSADGSFRFVDVPGGNYQIHATLDTNAPEWSAELTPVSVTTGQTTRDVAITPIRAGVLEVSVQTPDKSRPQAGVLITAYRPAAQSSSATTGSNGIARLHLAPGDYQLSAQVESSMVAQSSATVTAGTTNRQEMEIEAPQKINGTVLQPDGQPAANLPVQIVGVFGPSQNEVKTDAHGQFTLDWNPRQFPGSVESTPCLLVRDEEHNLAVARDWQEDAGALELKLAPALTLVGRAVADGKTITNASVQLVFWSGNRGSWLSGFAHTNAAGFEIPALPPGRRYGVIVSAPGYGQKQNHNLEISDTPGRQELEPFELMPANLQLAGQVLDADDKPVAGCTVNLNGENQPNSHVRTDKGGRFQFKQVCAGNVQIYANNGGSYGNITAEGGDTNVVLQLGQNSASFPGEARHKLKGVVTDAGGQPVAGAQVSVFPHNGNNTWTKTGANGEYSLNWALQTWQLQNGGPRLVVRHPARDLAAVEEMEEDTTNLDVKLKPALTLSGQVQNDTNAPMPGAAIGLWFKAGNSYETVDESLKPADAQGRFEIKCLPADGEYLVYASAPGFGKSQQNVSQAETNHLELASFVLKPANQVIAGQVLKSDDTPASGVNVNLNGDGQPDGYMNTDRQGRFHFRVCEGQIRLFAYSQSGGGNAQATVEAGDTNIVMNLTSSSSGIRQTPRRTLFEGATLPDLTTVGLPADAIPAGQPVLLCLFDASQRPSRHVIQLLNQQAAALQQKNLHLVGVQTAAITDSDFNDWKTASPVSFPVGRVTESTPKGKWTPPAVPWLVLVNASHHVIAQGFPIEDLDTQLAKLAR